MAVPSQLRMDFTFSPEQIALREAVRSFLVAEAPNEYVRRMAEHDDAGITGEMWRKIVDLGWTGLLVPESAGGLGLGLVDAVVVQEEMGRGVFPGPYFSSAILATLAARALGLDDQLEALAAGTQRGTVALDEAGYGDPIERVHVRANGRGTRYKLDGVKPMVPDGMSADWMLVPARTREGLQTFLVERPENASRSRASTSPASSRGSSSTRRARRSSARPATTPRSGIASSTTRAC